MRGNRWLKETYAYQVFAAGMNAYLSKYMWTVSTKYDPQREYAEVLMSRFCAVMMGAMGFFQVCINIGLIGEYWHKNKRS